MSEDPSRVLTAADIAAAPDRKIEKVDVPEWGGAVYLRSLTALEEIRAGEAIDACPEKTRIFDTLFISLATSLCHEDGSLLFDTPEAAREALGGRGLRVLNRLGEEANKLNGWESKTAKNASGGAVDAASPTA